MQPENDNGIELQFVRKALKDWHSLNELAENPISHLPVVELKRQSAGYSATAMGYGLALRELLEETLESLKPEDSSLEMADKRWRPYIILKMQFIEGRSPDFVQNRLHISRGTYFSEQSRAISLLSDCLGRLSEKTVGEQSGCTSPSATSPVLSTLSPSYPPYPFIGRDTLFSKLKGKLLQGNEVNDANSRPLIALQGIPGAGKTRIALELASDVDIRNQYIDGVLWAGLGQNPDVPALLGAWAAALRIPDEELAVHSELNERIALLHAAIINRRMLLVIDDAWQSQAALVFKLGGPNCAYILTTRLIDVAVDFAGNNVTNVSEMDLQDGIELLQYFLPDLHSDHLQDAASLVQSVGGLPLALILIGRYLQKYQYKNQPRRLKDAVLQLKEAKQRLQVSLPVSPLEANPGVPHDTPLSLQAAIGLSDSALDEKAHGALTALSAFPPKPNSFSEEAALAVTGAGAAVLDVLVDIGMVECMMPDRYCLHQTIYDYARTQAIHEGYEQRMVDYFVAFSRNHRADYEYLAQELVNLLAAYEIAHQKAQNDNILTFTNSLYDFLETRGLYEICQRIVERALTSAYQLEDERMIAEIVFRLGDLELRQGKIDTARQHLEKSVCLSHDIHDQYLETKASFQLGDANMFSGRWQEAQEIFRTGLALARTQGFQDQEGWILSALGYACMESCQFQSGIEYLEEALALCSKTGDRRMEGWSHFNLSLIYLPLGHFTQARQHADLCGICYLELGDQRGESWLVYHYGRLSRKKGQYLAARRFFEDACRLFYALGDRMGLGFSIHNLGLLEAECGDLQAAGEQYVQAMDVFKKTGCRLGESQCLQSLGELQRWMGNHEGALTLLGEALQIRQEFPYPRGIARAQSNLSLVYLALGEFSTAQQFARNAVFQARSIDARSTLAYALTCQGKVELSVGEYLPAQRSLDEALRLRRMLGQQHLLWEPLADLAMSQLLADDGNQVADFANEARYLLNLAPCTAGVNHPATAQWLKQDVRPGKQPAITAQPA